MRIKPALYIAVVMAIYCSCDNPFAAREPEPPKTSQSNWIQPTSPNYVLVNLRNAVKEKNKSNYLRCLADTSLSSQSFRFYADPRAMNANPGVFERWGKEEEAIYLNQLYTILPKDSLMTVTFGQPDETTFQDSVIFIQTYTLEFHEKCIAEPCLRHLKGQAEFRLLRTEDDLWYIYRWRDKAVADSLTWSDLKARFGK